MDFALETPSFPATEDTASLGNIVDKHAGGAFFDRGSSMCDRLASQFCDSASKSGKPEDNVLFQRS